MTAEKLEECRKALEVLADLRLEMTRSDAYGWQWGERADNVHADMQEYIDWYQGGHNARLQRD